MIRPAAVVSVLAISGLAITGVARAQCSYSASILGAYSGQGFPANGQQQLSNVDWTYEGSLPDGTGRVLLEGVTSDSWNVPDGRGAWGSPSHGYYIPLAGVVYSPDPAKNQNPYHKRTPSFDGIMLHPNWNAEIARVSYRAYAPMTLGSLMVKAEDLGSASPNATIGAKIELAGGGEVVLIPATTVVSLAAALNLSPSGGLPRVLNTGDRVVVWTGSGSNGDASEDWMNVDATLGLSGLPILNSQNQVHANCGESVTIGVSATGATSYRWYKDGTPLNDGQTGSGATISGSSAAVMTIVGFSFDDEGQYWCVVGNCVGDRQTAASPVFLCFGDFNCDGFVNGDDYDSFASLFESGDLGADINHDGFVNGDDYDAFASRFELGC